MAQLSVYARFFSLLAFSMLWLLTASSAHAQGSAFSYQGKLTDAGNPANGTYDLQLTVWDASSGGTQQPQPSPVTVTRTSVLVTSGIFTVQLDFGANAFPGADRFLEIGVRPAGGGAFAILAPRQQITATPYAVRSLNASSADTATNATQLGGAAASQYVQTTDSRLSDSRPPTAGSANYIQNIVGQQAGANFNIGGNGTIGGNLIANGNVGIGTNNPGAKLSVVNPGAPEPTVNGFPTLFKVGALSGTIPLALRQNANESFTPTLAWFETNSGGLGYLGASANTFAVGAATGKQLALRANGSTEGMVVGTNGQVGIGTTSPCIDTKLTVIINPLPSPCALNGVIVGEDTIDIAVIGRSGSHIGVLGDSQSGESGVKGQSNSGTGMEGVSISGTGVVGISLSGNLFEGQSGASLLFRVRNDGQVRSNVGFTTPAADFAELIEVDQSDSPNAESLQPGDVLIISRETGKLKKSSQPYSTLVAGVYSTKPGFLGNQGITDENAGAAVPVALVGVVPTKASAENGPIRAGDLLTTSSTPGFAMKASPVRIGRVKVYRTGTILGKALEPLKEGKGVIKVLVALR